MKKSVGGSKEEVGSRQWENGVRWPLEMGKSESPGGASRERAGLGK